MPQPPCPDALRLAGSAAFARREYATAVREFSRALALEPLDVPSLCNRSAALLAAGGAADALRDAEAAERAALVAGTEGALLKPLYRQAQALAALGIWDAVVVVCVRALGSSPSHAQLLSLLRAAAAAGAQISGDAVADALTVASSAAARAAAEADAPVCLSAAAAAASALDPEPAEPAQSDAAYAADCRARGNGAFGEREFGQAVAWYTHGLRETPDDAVLLSNRAAARLALGQLRAAALDAARAVELEPRYRRGALRAAVCHLRVGEYAAARAYCLRALDSQPSCAHALALLDEVRTADERANEVAEMADAAAAADDDAAARADADASAQAAPAESAAAGGACAWTDVLEHSALLLADAPLDAQLLAARARALVGTGDLDCALLLIARARERGAAGPALRAEWLASTARDGPLAEAVEAARAALAEAEQRGRACAERDDASAPAAAAAADAMAARAPAAAGSTAAAERARARLLSVARRVVALDEASRAARDLELGASEPAVQARAAELLNAALRACERGGATEAGLRARQGCLHAARGEWRAAVAACDAGLRAGARRAASTRGEGAAARTALLLRRALCHARLAQHADAAVDYAEALRLDPALSAARRGLAAAERALRLRATAGLYATLGVHVGAADSELRRAYHSLALRWHPDRHVAGGEAARLEAEVRFKEIAAAFETLSDPERRARYDVDMHFREGV